MLVEGAPGFAEKDKILYKLFYKHQQLSTFYYFLSGYSNNFTLQHVQSLDGETPFYIGFNDFTYFSRIRKKINLAFRLRLGLSSNEESPFAPFVLDSYLNIRGVGNKVDRGTGTIVLNAEYRHSAFDREKIAMQLVGFIDAGTWRAPGGNFNDFSKLRNQEYFGGVGFRLIHKKIHNAIFRLDYGIDLKNPSAGNGIVFGLGQYF